jgi:phospholipid/cholesterol/gamma-HCH transport system substrate-binding protein
MKSFSERNQFTVGAIGLGVTVGIVMLSLNFQKLPYVTQSSDYSAYFADAGGLHSGAAVDISGFPAGRVSSVELDSKGVLVKFKVGSDVHLGKLTEAAIKTKSLLGSKIMDVTPRGEGDLSETIPMERTTSPYQLPDALGDLTTTISGVNTTQLSDSLAVLAQTFANTAPDLRSAVTGVARFAQTLDQRDAHLRTLLDNANKATTVLAKRSDQVVALVKDTNALLAELRAQSGALDAIWGNISVFSQQLKAFIADNRDQLRPALDKLNGVLTMVDNRRGRVQEAINKLNKYAMSLGEAVSSGPFFKAYVANLLPGQFVQPFMDAAFSDLGIDPHTLTPSQLTDPQTGQPGTPALPVPYPRTGQGGEPRLTLPDAITGQPGERSCGLPGVPLPGPGCYPYREPPPAPPPGGPPPGPPAQVPADQQSLPGPTPSPVYVPAPGEVLGPQPHHGGQQ